MSVICLLCILFLFALADIKKRCIPTWGAVLYWLLGAVLYGCMWTERGWAPLIDGFVVIALCGAIKKIFPKDVGPGDLVLLAGLFLYTSGQMLWRGLGVAFFLNGHLQRYVFGSYIEIKKQRFHLYHFCGADSYWQWS